MSKSALPHTTAIPTPALILDLDVLERNIAVMAERASLRGVVLRPHAKSHKCSRIAAMQLAAGAAGICAATIDEAEVLAAAGITGLLVTSPQSTAEKIRRLMALAAKHDIAVAADHPANVAALGEAAAAAGIRLKVLVDLDVGQHRTGVAGAAEASRLASRIAESPSLSFAGLQAYAGQVQHIADAAERAAAITKVQGLVLDARRAIASAGHTIDLVTGSGTGSHDRDSRQGPFGELQVGSYVFMDEDYGAVAAADPDADAWPFEVSLHVRTAVVSAGFADHCTTDGGTKAFALNGPPPRVVTPPLRGAAYSFSGDEHGRVALSCAEGPILPGLLLDCVVSHCDPTVALYDRYYCLRQGELVDIWPIDARGRA